MGVLKKKFRSVKKLPDWIYVLPALLIKFLVRVLYRVRVEDPNGYLPHERGNVVVAWHNRLLFFPAVFPCATRKNTVAVVSASRDGQYIVDLIKQFGLGSLRGSSSRGGANAQLAAIRALREENKNVVFTPDGPRGPKYHLKAGPVHLASITGKPLVPVSINASRYWQVKSWDNFQIAKPFSTLTLVIGHKMHIPGDLDAEGLENFRRQAEERLLEITVDRPSR